MFTYDITHSPETKQGKRPVQVLVAGLEAFEQGPQVLGIWSSLEREVWAAPRQVPLALQTRYFPCRKLLAGGRPEPGLFNHGPKAETALAHV